MVKLEKYTTAQISGLANTSGRLVYDTDDNICKFLDGSNTVSIVNLDSSGKLGIGSTAPDKQLEINNSTGDCLRLTYNDSDGSATNYVDFNVDASGNLTITPSGGSTNIVGLDTSISGINSVGDNVGIHTTGPNRSLEINDASGYCLRLTYNDSDGSATTYTDFNVSSSGNLTIDPSGNDVTIQGNIIIDNSDTEAFLIRKDGDTGDVFKVNSSSNRVGINCDTPDNTLEVRTTKNAGEQIRISHGTSSGSATKYCDISFTNGNIFSIKNSSNTFYIYSNTSTILHQFYGIFCAHNGTASSVYTTSINSSTGDCLKLYRSTNGSAANAATIYADFDVTASGHLELTSSGGDVDITTHDGTNGLKLGGVNVTATAAEINYLDLTTGAGTAEASKALVLDGSSDITGINNLTNSGDLTISGHDGASNGLILGATLVTATASEINTLDGITSTTAELNILDGVTATAAEINYLDLTTGAGTAEASKALVLDGSSDITGINNLTNSGDLTISGHDGSSNGLILGATLVTATATEINVLDGITSTTAELNILDGVTATASEINYLDLTTGAGTAEANKALVLDGSKNITNINSITSNTCTVNTTLTTVGDVKLYYGWHMFELTNSLSYERTSIDSDLKSENNTFYRCANYVNRNIQGLTWTNINTLFAYKYSALVDPAYSETYTFTITSTQIFYELFIDGKLVANNSATTTQVINTTTFTATADSRFPLVLFVVPNNATNSILIEWESASLTKETVPSTKLSTFNSLYTIHQKPIVCNRNFTLYNNKSDNTFLEMDLATDGTLTQNINGSSASFKFTGGNLNVEVDDSSTNTILDLLQINRKTTGTAANNIGVGIAFNTENDAGTLVTSSSIQSQYTDVTDSSENASIIFNTISGGSLTQRGELNYLGQLSVTNVIETSDERVKENIKDSNIYDSFNKIKQIKLKDYNFIADEDKKQKTGVIAQELKKIIPTAIEISKQNGYDDFHGVDTRELLSHLIGSVQYIIEKLNIM